MTPDNLRRLALAYAAIARIEAMKLKPRCDVHPGALEEEAMLLEAIAANIDTGDVVLEATEKAA